MADIKFDIPERFSDEVAVEGKWFEVYDEKDNHWGDFKCAMVDNESRSMKLAQDRIRTKFARELRTKKFDLDAFKKEVLLDVVLLDWRGVKAGGKDVSFSKENARAYFDQPRVRHIVEYLMAEAEDVLNYQRIDKDEASGN